MIYIANALASSMLADGNFAVTTVEQSAVRLMVKGNGGVFSSAVGHTDTAAAVSDDLGFPVSAQRVSIRLAPGDTLIVAQLSGGRLPEGATTLPDGFSFIYRAVTAL